LPWYFRHVYIVLYQIKPLYYFLYHLFCYSAVYSVLHYTILVHRCITYDRVSTLPLPGLDLNSRFSYLCLLSS
jgi:hypothetical protein